MSQLLSEAAYPAEQIPAYVINLARGVRRLAMMKDAFDRLGLAFDRIDAIDAETMSETARAAFRSGRERLPLERGEIACFLSHHAAWTEIAAKRQTYAAIFEDDVLVADGLAALLRSREWIPPDADVVKLETHEEVVRLRRRSLPAPAGHALHRLLSRHLGTVGYLVSKQGLDKLLEHYQLMTGPVDHELFDPLHGVFKTLNVYQLCPAACIQVRFRPDADSYRIEGSAIPSRSYDILTAERANAQKQKISLGRKLTRETLRPFRNLTTYALRQGERMLLEQRPAIVPFYAATGGASHGAENPAQTREPEVVRAASHLL